MLAMGLAGIVTVALIASADQSEAGVDGMRAVTAFAPSAEQDPPRKTPAPVLGGVLDGLRDLPIFAPPPAPPAPAAAATPVPGGTTALPTPSAPAAAPPATAAPAPSTPAPTTPPAATPTTSPTVPPATITPSVGLSPSPTPSPTSSPTPGVALTTDRGASAIVSLADLVPGDTIARTITLTNTGTLGFRYAVSATQTSSTPLWTDSTDGLQLTVSTSLGAVLYSGPLSGLGSLAGPGTLAPGDSELLRYTFTFPASASDAFQGLAQDLTLVFTATQYP